MNSTMKEIWHERKKVLMIRGDSMTPARFWQHEWFSEEDVPLAKEYGFIIPDKIAEDLIKLNK